MALTMQSSSSSSSPPQLKYDVFLSFRGEDTRDNFTSHLHKALCDKRIQTFIDYQLNRGYEISPSLLYAIQQSQISVAIFSKNYASSRWCLEELVKILECKKMYGQIVIPVFYEVDPSDVRNQRGAFADAFAKHEQRFDETTISRWRTALTEAANLSGWDSLLLKPESVLIECIVEDVLKKLNDTSSSDNNDLIGIDSRIKKIESLLCIGSKDVRSVGLWGIGGIGKTTLAGAVFGKISSEFEGSYFIHNVREESEQSGGLNRLRQELISTILGDRNVKMGTAVMGRTFTKNRLGRMKLLIVFDDVTDFRQIESLIGGLDSLGSGSRIILTTRDKQVLKNCKIDQIYEVEELFPYDALKLFSRYAFGQNYPTVDYVELSNRVVTYCGGVPLALKVLGSSLFDKRKEIWESALRKLEKIPDKDIQKLLKISYDGLDDDVKNIFLDIACFFKGKDKDLVIKIMDASGFFPEIGISILIDKSLITVSNDKVTMHDLLQTMGREIVRQESINDPGKRTRLWHHDDIYHVLTKDKGTETIEGISLDMSKIRDIYLSPRAFAKMHNLRFLEFYSSSYNEGLNKVHVFQGSEFAFTELRYLHWHGYPFKSLLSNFYLENLVTLNMPYSNVEQLWNGVQHLVNLKYINIRRSKHLTTCPDLSGAPNLERVNLEGCTSLLELPSSILYLDKLDVMNLKNCKSLISLPNCIPLKSLRELILSGCSKLKMFPELPCNMEKLYLDNTAIEEVPSYIEHLCRLVILNLRKCSRLKSLSNSICKLKSLKYLYLSDCSELDKLPDDLGTLEFLVELEAKGTAIGELPSSIIHLNHLYTLSFEGCKGQERVGLLLPPSLGLNHLTYLNLTDCGITEIPNSLGCLSSLKRLYLQRNNFESLPASIINLSNLSCLYLSYCERLKCLPELPLIYIQAHNCTSLEMLSCFSIQNSGLLTDDPYISVDFINCFKLDWNVLKYIVEDALLKIHCLATLWKKEYYDKGYHIPPRASIYFPGSDIPKWFNVQSNGSIITIEPQPGWFDNNFVGFALCAVVAFQEYEDDGSRLTVGCECKYKSQDGNWLVAHGSLCVRFDGYIRSDHVFMGFDFRVYPNNIGELCYNNEISFQFYLEHVRDGKRIKSFKMKKCGIRLMYAEDVGEPCGSFSSDEEEFWEPMEKLSATFSSDEDELWESMEELSSGEDEFWESMEDPGGSFSSDEEKE
ncbi:hypothetical protein ACOSQ2_028831 [Xanthoceras sorbifolium]